MNEKIVLNTGPIIALGKMEAFDVIEKLPFEFISPEQVYSEILVGRANGYPVSPPLWLEIAELSNPLSKLALSNLDEGEAAVIELALQRGIPTVCLDELKGRRAAIASGLNIVGSLGLIGRAQKLGIISSAREFVEKAQNGGIYYDVKLVERFLHDLGE